jgi:hypothetical protein
MFVIHRGAGMLAPGFGLLFAILANVLTYKIFGGRIMKITGGQSSACWF